VPHAERPHLPGYGIEPADGGAGLLPWSWALERLQRFRHAWIASVDDDGSPHLAAVWAVWHDGALYFSTGGRSRKARNLVRRPACSVALDDPEESLVLQGPAITVSDPDLIARVADVYGAKYGSGFPDDSPLFAVAPRVAIAVVEAEFTSTPTRWTFDPTDEPPPTG
jgi:hypothetical protein